MVMTAHVEAICAAARAVARRRTRQRSTWRPSMPGDAMAARCDEETRQSSEGRPSFADRAA
ncbi:hypothetical protein WS70_24775 [Burkholderia mayonis]|uniref:Uncharacterized protein n=1 Tax=Burkholderia mayonis TaxID=1385591 RepID=A0A1B4FMR5_9BURK|nr:hypothetical protein WS70_24775 [Burkholderia mayonis]KVE40452.1 hypothetical protein WS69_06150 [Burkholderia sp. BDU5]KVE41507.1 hypothetical protein WS70_13760 [Burkholderia mayonis]